MIVVWWTGRGFLTAVILLLTLCAFGVVVQAIAAAQLDHPWFWGLAFIIAGCINWPVGTNMNRRRGRVPPQTLRERLTYRPRNRFLSLPMEIWSIPMIIGGVIAIIYGISISR